ncbi:AroM family protein [Bradyrhizobium genosp. SA-3]|uniref:AroM family protein n=1 Tax=Bradyrhizobium genosp. SA-3 TaxID=508868 RepID=UPI0032E4728F
MTSAVTQAATDLVREGAQLITSNCGFMIRYQEAVRAAVDVPVLLSSLLLAPFLERILPREKALGILQRARVC